MSKEASLEVGEEVSAGEDVAGEGEPEVHFPYTHGVIKDHWLVGKGGTCVHIVQFGCYHHRDVYSLYVNTCRVLQRVSSSLQSTYM